MANELQTYGFGDTFQAMQEQLNRMFNQMASSRGQRLQGQHIVPPAEAIEDDNSYRITLEVPGVDPKEADVSVVGNTLTIRAERQLDEGQSQGQQGQQNQGQQERGGRHTLLNELQRGTVRREFRLPEDADRNRINAEFRNGLLILTLPKSQEVHQRRRIDIKT